MAKQRMEHAPGDDNRQQPGPFLISEDLRLCMRCGDKATLNCFKRCRRCENQYQKDVLLQTVVAAQASKLDAGSMRLMLREFELRADELLARGESRE